MGKKRLNQLLEVLKDNYQRDLHNSAAIYTVAQVAVNELDQEVYQSNETPIAALPFAPNLIDKDQLLQQYGSYNGCRQAAKERGIKFSRTPSWEQLAAALSYAEILQKIIRNYVTTYPYPQLQGTKFELVFPVGDE
ncbi:hypothetical protein [Anabaenopsis elenkinii]|uniref:Uncharacterized protein n=1 Tax=Anabaenopsis elenkinii CCIBt3563 TaxID=2779889 RepID=A0A7U3RYE5_9CYAN|nr:hypothetical protein [Anabaenopsis elenkinii]QOV21380.1 hypothetical protein IM676_11455 [Anabaenopsis elenkinii CCIBt3563]